MKKILITTSYLLLTLPAIAEVSVEECVIREAISGSKMTAAFLNINNNTDTDLELNAANITELSDNVELHNTQMLDGVMKMQQVKAIPLKKGEIKMLKPGSLHIMLMNLKILPKSGENYEIKLSLSDNSEVNCLGEVKSMKEIKDAVMGHGEMNHKKMKH